MLVDINNLFYRKLHEADVTFFSHWCGIKKKPHQKTSFIALNFK